MYLPGNGAAQSLARRAALLADTDRPLSGSNAVEPCSGDPLMNVRSSRFLSPYKPGLKSLEEMRLSRICRAMRQAAISGSVFHLWWPPHNFGADIAENMAFLRRILASRSEENKSEIQTQLRTAYT